MASYKANNGDKRQRIQLEPHQCDRKPDALEQIARCTVKHLYNTQCYGDTGGWLTVGRDSVNLIRDVMTVRQRTLEERKST